MNQFRSFGRMDRFMDRARATGLQCVAERRTAVSPGGRMGQRNHDEDAEDWFGGDEPLDVAAADGGLALVPPSQTLGGSPFSWQCSRDPGDAAPCTTDKPGSMDFPQDGELLCACGAELAYRRRGVRG